jgi:hypothetical protein
MGMLGTTILTGALGGLVGVWRDSVSKTQTLQVKNQQIADLKTAPASAPATPVVPAMGETPAPAAIAAASSDGPSAGGLVQPPAPALKAA